jgi:DNA-binding transcriptional ArsR family regulator
MSETNAPPAADPAVDGTAPDPVARVRKTGYRVPKKTSSSKKGRTRRPGPVAAKPPRPKAPPPRLDYHRIATILKQAADPTRLAIIDCLRDGERYVGDLCRSFDQSQPAVSHHLALLRHGSVIEARRQGKQNFYSLTEKGRALAAVVDAMGSTL